MTLLETLALATLIVTVVYETVDVTLKVLQYIESKQNRQHDNAAYNKDETHKYELIKFSSKTGIVHFSASFQTVYSDRLLKTAA